MKTIKFLAANEKDEEAIELAENLSNLNADMLYEHVIELNDRIVKLMLLDFPIEGEFWAACEGKEGKGKIVVFEDLTCPQAPPPRGGGG